MDFLLQYDVVAFILVLTSLIYVHELGHYVVARMNGVRVEVFSIGFGPEIYGWRNKNGTHWKISLIPFGGYVKMFGDTNVASAPIGMDDTMTEEEKKVAFPYKKLHQRAAVVAAGPMANFLFAVVIFIGVYTTLGQVYAPPVVGDFTEDSASKAYLQVGDRILSINGKPMESFSDIQNTTRFYDRDEPMEIVFERKGVQNTVSIHPRREEFKSNFGQTTRIALLGITTNETALRDLPLHRAIPAALEDTWSIVTGTLTGLWQTITGVRSVKELGGPVQIYRISEKVGEQGLIALMIFTAHLSISLGLINLLPVPALDGGHLVFYFFEAILGKPLPQRAQEIGSFAGVALILMLVFVVTWHDIERILHAG
jgi:regulator of sigma E protease